MILQPGAATHVEPTNADLRGAAGANGITTVVAVVTLGSAAVLPLTPWLVDLQGYQAIVACIHALLCAVGAAISVATGFRPLLMVASVFPYCWLVVPSVYQISHELAAWGDNTVTANFSTTLRAQLLLAAAQGAFLLAYSLGTMLRPGPRTTWSLADADARRLCWVATALTLVTFVLVPFVVSSAGGLSVLFSSRGDFNEALASQGLETTNRAGRALVKTVPAGLATSAALLAVWLIRNRPIGDQVRRWAFVVLAADLVLLFITANPFVYSRYQVLAAFGPVLMAVVASRGRRGAVVWLLATLTAFLLAYPAAEAFRLGSDAPDRVTNPTLASKDFDGFQQTINAVAYVDVHGVTHGHFLSSGLLFFVPRAVWTDKAVPSTFPVADERGYLFQDLSMPFPAEAYLDFGWIGVAIVLGALGSLFALLDRSWRDQSWLAVLAAYLSLGQVGLWRGPFGSLAPVFGFAVGTLLLGVVLAGALGRGRAGGSDDVGSVQSPFGGR